MAERPPNRPKSLFARPRALLVDGQVHRIEVRPPPPIQMGVPARSAPAAVGRSVPAPLPEEPLSEAAAGAAPAPPGPARRLYIGSPRAVAPVMVRAGLDARTDVADAPEPPPGGDGTEFRFALPRETIRPAEDAALADLEEAGFFESQAVPSARPPERAIQPSLPTVRASSRKFVPRAPLPRRSVPTWALAFTGVVLLMVGLAGTWSRIREDVAPPAQPVLALPVAPQPVDPAAAVEPRVTTTPAEAPSRVLVGVLRVVSNAPGEIYVDGKYEVAVEEEVLLELPAGAYDVKLVPQRGLAQTQNVRVDAAEARDVVFQVN